MAYLYFYRKPTTADDPIDWKAFTFDEQEYAIIGNNGIEIAARPREEAFAFWTSLFSQYTDAFYEY